jgi:hypothetical protein
MNHDEAKQRAAQLNEAGDAHWLARPGTDGEWDVVKLTAPGLGHTRPTGAHVESRPRPEADDPRPANVRNIPPYGAGV